MQELGFVESAPKQDGRNMIMVLGPLKKKAEARAERAADKARRDEAAPGNTEAAVEAPVPSPAEPTESTESTESAVQAPAESADQPA